LGFCTYILWSDQLQKFYVGSTNNLEKRIVQHNTGQGKFTSKGAPWLFVWSFISKDRKEAFNLEHKIKKRGIKRFLEDNKISFGR
jgi:putative endonuclease